jgi:hypothetical protein
VEIKKTTEVALYGLVLVNEPSFSIRNTETNKKLQINILSRGDKQKKATEVALYSLVLVSKS